jgi:7-cyano-7-deazaguanine synthase in queuosine biosynthesis
MAAQGALEEEDFTGFNDCNKDTVREMMSMFEKLDLSNLECEKVR